MSLSKRCRGPGASLANVHRNTHFNRKNVRRVPRVARLLALAHRFDRLIADGAVASYAELAHLGQVSRARVSQIMSLLNLAADLQEAFLFLRSRRGRDPVSVVALLEIAMRWDWQEQRRLWRARYAAQVAGVAVVTLGRGSQCVKRNGAEKDPAYACPIA